MNDNQRLAPGDKAETGCWICDETDAALVKRWCQQTVPALFAASAEENGVELGPIKFYQLAPGEDRAGFPPPGSVQGSNVRLLVAEAIVTRRKPPKVKTSFLADLAPGDLELLRKITRRAALPHLITDAECDEVIERYGPVTAQKILKSIVDDKIAL